MLTSLLLTLAQAGGGGSFGSGGGGGGSYGGSGDGDGLGWLIYLLIRLIVRAPLIGVPLALLLAFVLIKGSVAGKRAHQGRVIHKGRARREARPAVSTASLRATDPAFDEPALLARAELAFRTAQDAWCAQELERLRPFVSDGVFERFSLQVADQRAQGWRQGMDELQVGSPRVVALNQTGAFDALTVHIPFSARISKLDLTDGERLRGSTLPEREFAECWTFLRRSGTRTRTEVGLIEGQCPNCGARLELARSARCKTCEAEVLSGEFDWVLTEITQASVWRAEEQQPTGIAAYRETDPGLAVALLEDQVSVAFWRLRQAERRGSAGPVASVGQPAWCAALEADWRGAEQRGRRLVKLDAAVGSVTTLGLLPGPERDRVLVEVLWDGTSAEPGAALEDLPTGARTLARHVFVLGRAAGQRTRWKDGLTTAHCTSCGGADTGELSDVCPWCDEPRRGGPERWLVEAVLPRTSTEVQGLLKELRQGAGDAAAVGPAAAKPVPRQLLLWSASLAGSDGQLSPEERESLLSVGRRAGLTTSELDGLTPRQLGLETWEAQEPPAGPVDSDEARTWLRELCAVALADGNLDAREERWLKVATERLGFVRADLNHALNRERARLYRETRAAKRA